MRDDSGDQVSTIEHSLLGLLLERPMHGYELYQGLIEHTGIGLIWSVKQSHLYQLLGKLETRGFVAVELILQESRPARKVFHLTEEGERAFRAWIASPAPRQGFKIEFLAKLYFAQRENPKEALRLLEEEKKLCLSWLDDMVERSRKADGFDGLVYGYRIGQLKAMLAWLERCEPYLADLRR